MQIKRMPYTQVSVTSSPTTKTETVYMREIKDVMDVEEEVGTGTKNDGYAGEGHAFQVRARLSDEQTSSFTTSQ